MGDPRNRTNASRKGRPGAGSGSVFGLAAVLAAVLAAGFAAAPSPSSDAGAQQSAAASDAGNATTTVGDTAPPDVLAAFGVSAGFPSYQTVAGYVSAQYRYLGFQFKGGYTPVGPYVGLELRGYPPVPVPVPLFVGVGGGYYGGNVTYFGTLGAHVPLSLHVRLDLEAGVANVPLLARRTWAPYLSVGVSYAFPVTPTYGGYGPEAGGHVSVAESAPSCEPTDTPDASTLLVAFHRTLASFLASARATYGSIYTDLKYTYRVTSSHISGKHGVVVIHYSGSVKTIATGKRESASGKARAVYRWNGCGWSTVSVDY